MAGRIKNVVVADLSDFQRVIAEESRRLGITHVRWGSGGLELLRVGGRDRDDWRGVVTGVVEIDKNTGEVSFYSFG